MWRGGTFSPLCPKQYLYADNPSGAQAYSVAYRWRMKVWFPLTPKFTKRSSVRTIQTQSGKYDQKVRVIKNKIKISHSTQQRPSKRGGSLHLLVPSMNTQAWELSLKLTVFLKSNPLRRLISFPSSTFTMALLLAIQNFTLVHCPSEEIMSEGEIKGKSKYWCCCSSNKASNVFAGQVFPNLGSEQK